MTGPFSGPPLLSQERIHGVTRKPSLAELIHSLPEVSEPDCLALHHQRVTKLSMPLQYSQKETPPRTKFSGTLSTNLAKILAKFTCKLNATKFANWLKTKFVSPGVSAFWLYCTSVNKIQLDCSKYDLHVILHKRLETLY